uniref:Integrase core domain containing protein n=1 Tax=Solanum tuberosum TaxID=4113 RepID=M1D8H6_SOLTU
MPSTWSRGEPLTPYNPELSKTLRRMNNQGVQNNPVIEEHEDGVGNENAQVPGGNLLGDVLRVQNPPEPRLQDNYRVEFNTVESPIVLPPLPLGHIFLQLDQQINQLSTTVNPHQPGTLPSNTIQNPKNDGHYMAVTTRGGKQIIDPHMSSEVEIVGQKDDGEIEVIGESKNATEKEAEIT